MSEPIQVPKPVRLANGIPAGPLALFSVWAMEGDRRGLWVGKAGVVSVRRLAGPGYALAEGRR